MRNINAYRNQIAKVYEIDAHGKFTVVVRSSFIRLHVYPTTNMNPCYRTDLPSICDSQMSLRSNMNLQHDRKRGRTRKTFYGKMRKLIQNQVASALPLHSSTTKMIITQQGHSYYGFIVSLFVICMLIVGFILWYIFVRTSQSVKSNGRLASENGDSDDSCANNSPYSIRRVDNSEIDLNSSLTNKTVDSFVLNRNRDTNYLERKLSDNVILGRSETRNEQINYENIQLLIDNLQKSSSSDLESINASVIGRILSDLFHQVVDIVSATPNLQTSTDLQTFLSYAPQFLHILRTIITDKRSFEPFNSTNSVQCQYLIDILHYSEFILEYLHRHYAYEKVVLMKILTHLYQNFTVMNNNSDKHQRICQSLFTVLEKLNRQSNSFREG